MRRAVETAVAAIAFTLLTVVWHWCGLAPMPEPGQYVFTEFFVNCFSLFFFAAVFLLAALLARFIEASWSLALGFIIPLAVAMQIEIVRNATSHNLMPFEIVLNWAPLFVVAFAGANAWRLAMRVRAERQAARF